MTDLHVPITSRGVVFSHPQMLGHRVISHAVVTTPSSRIFSRDRNHAVGQPENLHAPRLQLTHRSGSTISCHLCGNRGRKKRIRPALKTPRYKVPRNTLQNKTPQFPHWQLTTCTNDDLYAPQITSQHTGPPLRDRIQEWLQNDNRHKTGIAATTG